MFHYLFVLCTSLISSTVVYTKHVTCAQETFCPIVSSIQFPCTCGTKLGYCDMYNIRSETGTNFWVVHSSLILCMYFILYFLEPDEKVILRAFVCCMTQYIDSSSTFSCSSDSSTAIEFLCNHQCFYLLQTFLIHENLSVQLFRSRVQYNLISQLGVFAVLSMSWELEFLWKCCVCIHGTVITSTPVFNLLFAIALHSSVTSA